MSEWMLRDLAARLGASVRRRCVTSTSRAATRAVSIGHSHPEATLLVKVACQHAAVGVRAVAAHLRQLTIRRPMALACATTSMSKISPTAHLRALDYLRGGGASTTLNCGYGHGYSVREVLRMVEQVHGQALQITEETRREGDPPTLVARADRIRQLLGWRPHHDDLETIVATQLAWERTLQARPELCRN
jgi:UDP-glucose 4-epimerase